MFRAPCYSPPGLSPKPSQLLPVGYAERELLAQRVVRNAGEFAQRLVDVFRTHADALLLARLQRLRVERDRELLLVGGADHPVSLDAAAEEKGRADRPVVLAVAGVVGRRPPHLALNDDDELVPDLQL